ncbi:MAG TPA: hypothetical protein V6D17_11420 [Candidatus Obscuribacterales bacterium]
MLNAAGIVSEEELEEELGYARELGMPIGQVLVASGYLTKQEMLDTIQVQSLVLSGKLSNEAAVEAVRLICEEGADLATALQGAGHEATITDKSYRLGELLISAELLSEEELAKALVASADISSPLGHTLIQLRILRPEVVVAALNVQRQLRTKEIDFDEAVTRIKAVMKFHKPIV